MASEIFLQHWIFTRFLFPFLLVWFIVFAILEKTKLLGEGKKQIDAIVAGVIALIFVGVAYPVLVVNNLILFLTIGIIVVFVGLLLWGFLSGGEIKAIEHKGLKWTFGIVIALAVIIAIIWATGSGGAIQDFLFNQKWGNSLWTNIAFVVVIAIVLAVILRQGKKD